MPDRGCEGLVFSFGAWLYMVMERNTRSTLLLVPSKAFIMSSIILQYNVGSIVWFIYPHDVVYPWGCNSQSHPDISKTNCT